ncbi:excinuclease ABC subunit UvrA [Erysipelotrichaceae bacterium AF15-26LB]|nr:putative excinuclease ABC, A subunit [Erysipelotrichaceae bacterium 3_1_53]MCR0347806.1 excinuclease ABC subunit UvrA [[Clostridium] innocuum]RJV92365.1 excinuclease ABC subunit UvrA [Erysipelotrichaceae bacterium AF15-26LB]RJV92614.1 excinuclease ABC subunit UvrA [Erysipelotrichaceae bacterium AF19-24AC]
MTKQNSIVIKGLHQNNLKHVALKIPKEKIVVFTGVSGSGKSSIVFDTLAAESQRQMNETYTAFIRSRLPKYEKPKVDFIDHLSASVIIDQSRLQGNARSTVGTISDLYSMMRLLFSRIGEPHIKSASSFSFNDPAGMCPKCYGLGKIVELDLRKALNQDKSWCEGMVDLPAFHPGNWYYRQYTESGLFDVNKKLKDYTEQEYNLLLYGAYKRGGKRLNKRIEGIHNHFSRLLINRDHMNSSDISKKRLDEMTQERECPLCHGRRLHENILSCRINGYNIAELCEMEFLKLRDVLLDIKDTRAETIIENLIASLTRMIDIGLPYLSMNRESSTLSGGEAQRLKLVRHMGSSLTGLTYIFDEPSTGMHPRDVYRMTELLRKLRDRGNSVLVVEHDKDVISIADEIIDVGPFAGKNGGQIMFQGSYEQLLCSHTLTGRAMREQVKIKEQPRIPLKYLPVTDASIHNLKHISVDIPLQVLTVVSGVAGSGKSSLIRDVFAKQYKDRVVMIDQSPITATGRSTPATFLDFSNDIRKIMAVEHQIDVGMFSFNSKGGCPHCHGKGDVVTELVFMDPVTTKCEMCEGKRYSEEALSYRYRGKNISEIMELSVEEALKFFSDHSKIYRKLKTLSEVGLSYLSLGQPLSTLSGGERQRIKLAKHLKNKGNIFILDEPTTGLHASDIKGIMKLLEGFVNRGNTVIIIEHNLDVLKQADYVIDIGPDGGTNGGEIVFIGTPRQMLENAETITAQYLRKSCAV